MPKNSEAMTFMTPFGFIPDFLPLMNMVSGGHLAKQGFAPKLIGGGVPIAQGRGVPVAEALSLGPLTVEPVGDDLLLRADVRSRR